MTSSIRVYLFPDTSKYFISEKSKIIKDIEKDTHTYIKYINKQYDSFFKIDGKFEDVHQARIIIQDLERDIYREVHLKTTFNDK
tara:strand:+ start:885 stop:1136 length:252 start_codon:yes stop_codon:yes gene_type:complete